MNISRHTFQFLKDLKANNDREWFEANRSRYEQTRSEFTQFIDELIKGIAKFDPSISQHKGKDCIFRIYRDVRFSKDKSPYKTNLGAHVTSAASKSEIHSRAGYYIQLSPGDSFLAGGAYLPQGLWLKAIRQEIDYNAGKLKAILKNKNFKQHFGQIEGEKLKKAPRGYPVDHPEIELLKFKSFLAVSRCSDKDVLSGIFLSHCVKVFKALYPFDRFLNDVLD